MLVVDAMRVKGFLLGRNSLSAYQVSVDLIAMKIVVGAPVELSGITLIHRLIILT